MPQPENLNSLEVAMEDGYYPSSPALAPEDLQSTIRRGSNVWLRPSGKIEVADGLLQTSATNVGARIFAADIQRATIAGGLVSSRLPYAGFLRYQNFVLLYLSENTSSQVYLDETAVTNLTTSSTAGRLRVAIPDGSGGYNVFDAGFQKPVFDSGDVAPTASLGVKNMRGFIGVAIAAWRSSTNANGPPSEVVYNDIPAGTNTVLALTFPTAVSGQDGWLILGTRWGDASGQLRVVRYMYIFPRGTLSATNGVAVITGTNTFWTRDLALGDIISIDAGSYTVTAITSDTSVTLNPAFFGSTGSGKTITMGTTRTEWLDGELGVLVDQNIQRPPRAAGVLQFSGRVFLWGIPDMNAQTSSSATGNSIAAMLDGNPEHIGLFAIVTASGSDLVNVLAGDGPMYCMTTTSLEIVNLTSDPREPYNIRIVAEPGFKAATNGVLYKDWFYGFNGRPLRTRARENIDVLFAQPVWEDMESWDATRVMLAIDPLNDAILFMYDDGAATTVLPFMAQLNRWGPPLNFSARIIDSQVVNGKLYVTYLSSGNYRVNEWEGGTGIGGTRYVASQYYDARQLYRSRLKRLAANGKLGTLYVYAATPGAAVPDVSDTGAAVASFSLSDALDRSEAEIFTNIEGRAFAFRLDFASNDGTFQKLIARGTPKNELK